MSCSPKWFDCRDDRRGKQRRPISIAASAVCIDGSKSVMVEDLSVDGAKLSGRGLPKAGKQILVWMDGIDVLGCIAWSKFGGGGVVFDGSLDPGELRSLEEQAAGARMELS